jgi:error-prone DNA polymerase
MAGRTVLEWDKDDIDALGLMKVDILALGMLSCLRRGFELLKHHHRLVLDLASVPREDAETYAMLRRADSLGVFQVESRAQMNMLPRLRPTNFYDIVVQVAIIRPGPIQGDMVHPYLRWRWGLEEAVYPQPHPDFGPPDELERVLKRRWGCRSPPSRPLRLRLRCDARRLMATHWPAAPSGFASWAWTRPRCTASAPQKSARRALPKIG